LKQPTNSKKLRMALTLVKNKVCNACGSDVRPNSLFCYNCGGAIVVKDSEENISKEKEPEEKEADKDLIDNNIIIAPEPEKPETAVVEEEPKLKSAAGLRRKPKSIQKKTIEVVWEEHENAPNVWFLAVAIVLVILVATILFLAMYLK